MCCTSANTIHSNTNAIFIIIGFENAFSQFCEEREMSSDKYRHLYKKLGMTLHPLITTPMSQKFPTQMMGINLPNISPS